MVRNDIKSLERVDIGLEGTESLWVELRNRRGKRTLMTVIYRAPNSCSDVNYKL